MHFTCNACGERSQKLINRLAYEKGTVFVEVFSFLYALDMLLHTFYTIFSIKLNLGFLFLMTNLMKIETLSWLMVISIQCSGCLKYHNLVDNLNLVVEYNFLEEISDTDEAWCIIQLYFVNFILFFYSLDMFKGNYKSYNSLENVQDGKSRIWEFFNAKLFLFRVDSLTCL